MCIRDSRCDDIRPHALALQAVDDEQELDIAARPFRIDDKDDAADALAVPQSCV